MDPTTNLTEQLRICKEIDTADIHGDSHTLAMKALELAEHVRALHAWMRDGGFLPEQWDN